MPRRSPNQPSLFPLHEPPQGLLFQPEIMSPAEEEQALAVIRELPFGPFVMHGVEAKRRIVHFGLRYGPSAASAQPAPTFPSALEPLRMRAGALAGIAPSDFAHALVTEYQPGAGIGWHRDSPPFGIVAGISLGAGCTMRFRHGLPAARETWDLNLPARSLYLLTGPAREEWEHSIPPVTALRYSITFRTLRSAA